MRKIIYYVATSLDGYIAGPGGDISGFVPDGSGVKQYLEDLKAFDTVIMGRSTYEFGYQYGLKAGSLAYPHMRHYIFSSTMTLEQQDPALHICEVSRAKILELKAEEGTDIYLCGGGIFAGWLWEEGLIDQIKIKLNPLMLHGGTRILAGTSTKRKLHLLEEQSHDHGLKIMTYEVEN